MHNAHKDTAILATNTEGIRQAMMWSTLTPFSLSYFDFTQLLYPFSGLESTLTSRIECNDISVGKDG
jgi:hypothetical protein